VVGQQTQLSVKLTNAGATTIDLTGDQIDADARGAFHLPGSPPASLEPGGTVELNVVYTAASPPGADTATLEIDSSAQNPVVQVSLVGQSIPGSSDGGSDGGTDGGSDGGCGASPAGCVDRWIAFDSDRDQGNRDIYAVRPDGTQLKRLTNDLSDQTRRSRRTARSSRWRPIGRACSKSM
jgi:hypothetical protein